MEQLRALILVSLAIMILNSCSGQNKNSTISRTNQVVKKVMDDTILISRSQFEIIVNKEGVLDIEIKESNLIDTIADSDNPTLKIELDSNYIIAKGNNIISSSVPENCDYFYLLRDDNKVFMKNERIIYIRKIE
ncbi:MAG: hypothetical protein AAFP89_14670 [Bacteroidota bacterium]